MVHRYVGGDARERNRIDTMTDQNALQIRAMEDTHAAVFDNDIRIGRSQFRYYGNPCGSPNERAATFSNCTKERIVLDKAHMIGPEGCIRENDQHTRLPGGSK
ncbi:hypothetical protein BE61_31230 [Bradyrhizobium elkanii USDA 61]|nr:hypothetical protein BE61_31230 [Bradyrhizobium elkanii USDA 61]